MGNCLQGPAASTPPQQQQARASSAAAAPPAVAGMLAPFVGCNCYYLMTRAADLGCRPMVLQTLQATADMGFTVLRVWAFNDGPGWMSLQPTAGAYNEQVLVGLDWLLVEAGKLGLRLMLTLTNFWAEFGGMPQYVRWAQGLPDGAQAAGDAFFHSAEAQQLYQNFITMLISRTNSISGVPYRQDPAIHSWDIANEPRCEGEPDGQRVAAWVHATAAHVKSLDSSHLVTVGCEGFFGASTPALLSANPYNVTHGVDWVAECSSPHIDFASIHMYADQWCPGGDSHVCKWSSAWVSSHAAACRQHLGGKPLVLQEFGKKPGGRGRAALFEAVSALARPGGGDADVLRGSMVWMFAHESYPDYDGYTVYAAGCPDAAAAKDSVQPVVRDGASPAVLRALAASVAARTPVAAT